jgi:hypothetical protein
MSFVGKWRIVAKPRPAYDVRRIKGSYYVECAETGSLTGPYSTWEQAADFIVSLRLNSR